MLKPQEFINKCDILLNEEVGVSIENAFKEYFEPFLLMKDYDALITIFGLYINQEIKKRMYTYRKAHNIDDLPERLDNQKGIELCNEVKNGKKSIE